MTSPRSIETLRAEALAIWRSGVDAVLPSALVSRAVQVDGRFLRIGPLRRRLADIDRLVVVGAGKAATGMAAAFEAALGPDALRRLRVSGCVNTIDSLVRPLARIRLHPARPAGDPVPTAAGAAGSRRMLRLLASLSPRDLAVCLLSGGASALMPLPMPGLRIADKVAVTRLLDRAGASIRELNTVRKHLSAIKGGRLAAASQAGALVSLILSDVIGSPLDIIASGPTAADPSTYAESLAILDRYGLAARAPARVIAHLRQGAAGQIPETPKTLPAHTHNAIVGDLDTALRASTATAARFGYRVLAAPEPVRGESREAGQALARLLRRHRRDRRQGPVCLLSGGEPVVSRVAPGGKGGRNQEFVLGASLALADRDLEGAILLAAGTDGEDGPTDAAGAWLDARVRQAALARRLDPRRFLRASRSYEFFDRAGGLLRTGPTGTNVMDIQLALIA